MKLLCIVCCVHCTESGVGGDRVHKLCTEEGKSVGVGGEMGSNSRFPGAALAGLSNHDLVNGYDNELCPIQD